MNKSLLYFPKNYNHSYIFTYHFWQLYIEKIIAKVQSVGGGYYLKPIQELFEKEKIHILNPLLLSISLGKFEIFKEDEEDVLKAIIHIIDLINNQSLTEEEEIKTIQLINDLINKKVELNGINDEIEALIHILQFLD